MKSYLKGRKIGKLTVLEETDERRNGAIVWKCRCDCGNEILVDSRKLSSGKIQSCGCDVKKYPKNIAGMRFGRLEAIKPTEKRVHGGYVVWECRCDCGNRIYVSRNSLVQGMTRSCGCSKVNDDSVIGQKYGNVTVLDVIHQSSSYILCRCRCDCGREFTVRKRDVLSGKVTDCGCMTNPDIEKIDMNRLDHPVQGRIPKGNKSGCKGVSYNANRDKWMARLMYRGKNYFLGEFDNLTDAVNARTAKEIELKQIGN